MQWVQVLTFGKQTLDWCFALFETGSKLWANRGWLIYLRTARRQKTCCVSSEIGGAESFSTAKTHLFAFSWPIRMITDSSLLRMIAVSEIVRVCQMSNYLLDINWPHTDLQNPIIRKAWWCTHGRSHCHALCTNWICLNLTLVQGPKEVNDIWNMIFTCGDQSMVMVMMVVTNLWWCRWWWWPIYDDGDDGGDQSMVMVMMVVTNLWSTRSKLD